VGARRFFATSSSPVNQKIRLLGISLLMGSSLYILKLFGSDQTDPTRSASVMFRVDLPTRLGATRQFDTGSCLVVTGVQFPQGEHPILFLSFHTFNTTSNW
jgi:hypothetical protein